MRLRIIEVGPDETDQEAIDRAAAEKPEAPRMNVVEFRSRVSSAIDLLMRPRTASAEGIAAAIEELEGLLDGTIARDIAPLLARPPQVCPVCGKTFRGLLGGEWGCYECREKAKEAAKDAKRRAEIEAEVRERMAKTGEC